MTTDIKTTDEIVILKNNEEREEIIAKNGEFIIDTYPGMKLKDIPNRFEFITNNAKIGLNRTTMQELDRTQKRSLTGQ